MKISEKIKLAEQCVIDANKQLEDAKDELSASIPHLNALNDIEAMGDYVHDSYRNNFLALVRAAKELF